MITADPTFHIEATPRGADHHQATLTWEQVREIRALAPALSNKVLALRFGVPDATIWRVVTGRSYVGPSAELGSTAWLREKIEISVSMEPNSGCWLWMHGAASDGYGYINFGGTTKKAHRTSFEAFKGHIPRGMCVCHRCDTPSCCNPEHLFLGTRQMNIADMDAKGRRGAVLGEAQRNAKLNPAAVRAIRCDGRKQREIAAAYGLRQSTVWAILQRKTWKHVQ